MDVFTQDNFILNFISKDINTILRVIAPLFNTIHIDLLSKKEEYINYENFPKLLPYKPYKVIEKLKSRIIEKIDDMISKVFNGIISSIVTGDM